MARFSHTIVRGEALIPKPHLRGMVCGNLEIINDAPLGFCRGAMGRGSECNDLRNYHRVSSRARMYGGASNDSQASVARWRIEMEGFADDYRPDRHCGNTGDSCSFL
jgi:hypothetical protein